MPNYRYSYKGTGAKHAKAQLHDVDASFKDLGAVCDAIRRKDTEEALELLEKASRAEVPIYYKKHNAHLGHRRELGGKKGRYPKKAARIVLALLKNVVANAQNVGLDSSLIVVHACANKQMIYPRLAPKGTNRRANYETARIELAVEESPEAQKNVSKKKETAAKALSAGEKNKLVDAEAKKLATHVSGLVKKKAQEKKEGHAHKEGEEHAHVHEHKEGAHPHEHSHSHEKGMEHHRAHEKK